jgi:type VI protein secretion system component Hcp
MRTATLLVLSLVTVILVSHVLADPAFVKIEGLAAPTQAAHNAHPGPAAPLQVLNFVWGPMKSNGTSAIEWKWGPSQQGSAILTRTPDALSTKLQAGATATTRFPHVIITRYHTVNGQQQIYERVTLTNAIVSSVRRHDARSNDGGITHLEDVTLLYDSRQIQAVTGTVLPNGTFKYWQKGFGNDSTVFPK